MRIQLDITKDILEQFATQLGGERHSTGLELPTEIGQGKIEFSHLAHGLEFYHFSFFLNVPVEMNSFNPPNSEFLLININLSLTSVDKRINETELQIQKSLAAGMLLYIPDIEVSSHSPVNKPFDIVLIRMHKSFLETYPLLAKLDLFGKEKTIVYEDLKYPAEQLLWQIIESENKLMSHALLLQFLNSFFDQLALRDKNNRYEHLHEVDIKGLFKAAAILKNPLPENVPEIIQLAKSAGMSATKFKTSFRQVFGIPPMKYHLRVKMEFAKLELQSKSKTASEVSHALGYSHPSKFTSAFKKYHGTLPSQI